MAKFNFYLRDKNTLTKTPIVLYIVWSGNRLKYATNESIEPKNWNESNQRVVESRKTPFSSEINIKLQNILSVAKNQFTAFELLNHRPPSKTELKSKLDSELNRIQVIDNDTNVLNYINRFISNAEYRTNDKTGKPISRGTIHTYNQLRENFSSFCKFKRRTFDFVDIDLDFYDNFNEYLIKTNLHVNTIGKRIAILKTILNDATERGLNKTLTYKSKKFKVQREKTENIYLNESELLDLYQLDLTKNKKLDNIRDLFLIGCFTGLRFSDWSKVKKSNIVNDNIEIETQKTRELVSIPLHPIVIKILDKHNWTLPKSISNQKTNEYLKELGLLAESLDKQFSKKSTKGGVEITKNHKKFELLTTHTARRSFASNLYLKGCPSQFIMKITGHKSEKSFMQYIKITPQENAENIRKFWNNHTSHLKIA